MEVTPIVTSILIAVAVTAAAYWLINTLTNKVVPFLCRTWKSFMKVGWDKQEIRDGKQETNNEEDMGRSDENTGTGAFLQCA